MAGQIRTKLATMTDHCQTVRMSSISPLYAMVLCRKLRSWYHILRVRHLPLSAAPSRYTAALHYIAMLLSRYHRDHNVIYRLLSSLIAAFNTAMTSQSLAMSLCHTWSCSRCIAIPCANSTLYMDRDALAIHHNDAAIPCATILFHYSPSLWNRKM